jgi:hypothetical protein
VRRTLLRLLLAVVVSAVVTVLSALAVTLVDLYLVGHGRAGLLRESISWPAAGVHLSAGDVIMLGLALLAAVLAWTLSGRRS